MNSQIQTIKVQRLYLQVAQQLEQLIASGEFEVGKRLPAERDLAGQFGVSRPTIREAMIALEIAGLVEVRSGSGVYVTGQKARPGKLADDQAPGPFEILEARRTIESEACALAAERISDSQLEELESLLEEMQNTDQSAEEAEAVDHRFHCIIADACGNSAIAATIVWLWQLRNESEISTRFHRRVRQEGSRPIIQDHRSILAALRNHDGGQARLAMVEHLQRVIDTLLESTQ
jgi:GntR family transcriptional repressor for pyruvate dehydrogenase complex